MLPEKGGRGKYLFLPGIKGRVANNATFDDTWSIKDKIYLLDAIEMKGQDIDWNDVSKKMKEITNHPSDEEWLAPQSCSRQYQGIMDTVGRIVKKEKDRSLLHIVREHYVQEYLKELKSLADAYRKECIKLYIEVKKAKGEEYDERMEIEEVPPPIIEDVKINNLDVSNAENIHKKEQGINIQGTDEEEEDLADLMSILPDGLEFEGDEIDTSIMDTNAFDIASPTDSSPAMKKALDATSSPKVSPQLKNLAMAHQTSSSLKNLVRSAIAGTSEDGPRNALTSAGSSSAPTLSMLLEMPPRDPGMPLPEISAMSSSKPTDQSVSPQKFDSSLFPTLKSPQSLAALDQMNLNKSKFSSSLILKTPEKVHQDGQSSSISPNKSSSPTLKRLLEGNTLSAKDESMAQSSPLKMTDTTSSSTNITSSVMMEVEIKKEQDQDFGLQQQQNATNVSSKSTIMNNNSVMTSPNLEIKTEENDNLTCSNNKPLVEPSSTKMVSQLPASMQVDNKSTPSSTTTTITATNLDSSKLETNLEECKGVLTSEQNDLKGDQLIQKISTSNASVEGTTSSPARLPADLKDKVNNLKDLVVIPGSSPIKTSPTSVNNTHQNENVTTASSSSISDVSTLSSPLKSSSGDWTSVKDKSNISVSQSSESTSKKLVLSDENKSYTLKSENISAFNKDKSTIDEHGNKVEAAPKLEPSVALSHEGQKSDTVTRDDLNHGHPTVLNIDNGSGGMPNISKRDSDEEEGEREDGNESPRKKVLYPSKTYSRKERERYETEPMEVDDDSSNSAFESKGVSYSPSRSSPSRGLKRHGTDGKPERRGRKPGSSSESRTSENFEEDGRITRARARPSPVSSPSKQAINTASPMKPLITSTPVPIRSHTPELEGKSIATRSRTISATSSTSSTLPGSSISIEGVEPISKDSDATKTTQLTPASTTTSISRKLKPDHETSETLETPVVSTSRGRGRPPMSSLNQRSLDLLPGSSRIDSNPSSPSSTTTSSTNMEEDKEQRTFRRNIAIVLDQIKSHKYASIFLKPTTAPSYLEVVKKPMDISTIRKNIDSGQIRNIVGFERDILLMFVNAITYNSETSEIYRMAKDMEADVRTILNNYKITQGLLPQRSVDQETWGDSDSSTVAASTSSTVTKPPEKRRGRPRLKDRPKPKEEPPSAGESGAGSECDEPEQVERGRKKESSPDIVDVIHGEGKGRRSRSSTPTSSSQDD